MSAPTAGQSAIAHAVSSRIDAGDHDGRILADLMTVLTAFIADMPVETDRLIALEMVGSIPDVVANQMKKMARAA